MVVDDYGERRLANAILLRAWRDALGDLTDVRGSGRISISRRSPQIDEHCQPEETERGNWSYDVCEHAMAWFASRSNAPLSFQWWADLAGHDPDTIRKALAERTRDAA